MNSYRLLIKAFGIFGIFNAIHYIPAFVSFTMDSIDMVNWYQSIPVIGPFLIFVAISITFLRYDRVIANLFPIDIPENKLEIEYESALKLIIIGISFFYFFSSFFVFLSHSYQYFCYFNKSNIGGNEHHMNLFYQNGAINILKIVTSIILVIKSQSISKMMGYIRYNQNDIK